jgi:RNA polymerase sigma-70 factor, ECF subfamily
MRLSLTYRGKGDPGRPAEKDRELVYSIKHGDPAAWQRMVMQYQARVHATAARILRNEAEAEECTQEIFLKVYNHIQSFREESSLSTWIYQIAYRTSLNRRAEMNRRQRAVACERDPDALPAEGASPEAAASRRELADLAVAKLDELPEEQRLVLILGDMQGLDYQEIAAVLDCPLGTAKSRLHRARRALRDKLTPHLRSAKEG